MWQSADPILNDYLDGKRGMGGVFNSMNLGLYSYTHNRPVNLIDPDGKDVLAPIAYRYSSSTDISNYRGSPYPITKYGVYNYNTPKEYMAAAASGQLTKPSATIELSHSVRSEKGLKNGKGSILGTNFKIAEMHNIPLEFDRKPKHAISITDIGKGDADKFTVEGTGTKFSAIRAHSGGPYGSEGCQTCPLAKYAGKASGGFETELLDKVPSLNSKTEKTYIILPPKWGGD